MTQPTETQPLTSAELRMLVLWKTAHTAVETHLLLSTIEAVSLSGVFRFQGIALKRGWLQPEPRISSRRRPRAFTLTDTGLAVLEGARRYFRELANFDYREVTDDVVDRSGHPYGPNDGRINPHD